MVQVKQLLGLIRFKVSQLSLVDLTPDLFIYEALIDVVGLMALSHWGSITQEKNMKYNLIKAKRAIDFSPPAHGRELEWSRSAHDGLSTNLLV